MTKIHTMQKKLKIAILTGGNVAERGISLKSAKTIEKHLDQQKYDSCIIELNQSSFIEQATGIVLDKNDFSLTKERQHITFDVIFLILHGHPAEDGSIQGYFELLGIPCTGCDHFVSALTFNKQATKDYLRPYGIPMADSRLIRKGQSIDIQDVVTMGFPLFVKPNKNGSSYGISKVEDDSCIQTSIQKSFQFDDEVIVEQFIEGREFSNGVFRKRNEVVVLPITEIISKNEFFDYQAKYENESEEITPAVLTYMQTQRCQAQSKRLYELLNCKGMVRFDYIFTNNRFHLLEANTIPGWSEQSIFPQQVIANGMTLTECLDAILAEALMMNSK